MARLTMGDIESVVNVLMRAALSIRKLGAQRNMIPINIDNASVSSMVDYLVIRNWMDGFVVNYMMLGSFLVLLVNYTWINVQ